MSDKGYAVITGASSGLGREFAHRLSKDGYPVVLIARRKDKLNEIAEELCTEAIVIVADLSRLDECKRVFEEIAVLDVDILINNAGFGDCGYFPQTDLDKELQMIDVNVKALHTLTKMMVVKMNEAGHGKILNIASSAGLIPGGPYMATYYATKAYVTSITRAVACELREHASPVYVGCLCPGPVDTEFNSVANVSFALRGISASYCVNYSVDQMYRGKRTIIPTLRMKFVCTFGRLLPQELYIKMTGHQQKKKFTE